MTYEKMFELIKFKMKIDKISCLDIARRMGVSKVSVYAWMNGTKVITAKHLIELLHVLKLDFHIEEVD